MRALIPPVAPLVSSLADKVDEGQAMRLIIAYKASKGAAMLLAGLALSIAVWFGQGEHLHSLAMTLREYVTARLAVETAELLLKIATPSHLALTSLAIALDGTVSIVEAWLLHRGQRWAIWLVVTANSALIPWELYELVAHFRWLRVALLIVNVGVVVYLGRQASRHVARRKAQRSPRPARSLASSPARTVPWGKSHGGAEG
jgi:uncharacterized membrane protein (DUF2068 family)